MSDSVVPLRPVGTARENARVPARVASARFVGREPELAELLALVDEAADERGGLAFVTGESGMGKTRLVNELARRARADGARVLSGDCVELGESELPYAPIVSALRPLARRQDPVLEELGRARGELAQLLPELGADPVATPPIDPTSPTAQGRLYEVLLALLERIGREQPLVLIIEDIHWADRSTRDFLVFLSRTICRERVLVVCTYRSDELHRRHPLRPVMNELERGERARRIPLSPFTRDELASQLEDILGAPPSDAVLDTLLARSEGNPLYAEELLAAGGDGSADLPASLRDALMVRVEALSPPAQELLRVVAAAQRLDHEVLRDASGLEGRELREALREAVAERLLEPDEDGRYAFRHALLREAVHDDLLPGEHAELHRTVAEALERRASDDLQALTEIAHHWNAAGDRERALTAAVRAARAAQLVHAMGEAADHLERALELWDRVPDPGALAGFDHIGLLCRAADAHRDAGEYNRMRTLLRQALEEIDREADPRRAARTLERVGKASWELGKGDEAMAAYEEALAILPQDEPTPERAKVRAEQGRALMLAGRYDESAERCRAAIADARAAGNVAAEVGALNTLAVDLANLGDLAAGEEAMAESMRIAREEGRVDDVVRGYVNHTEMLYLAGRAREAQQLGLAGLAELEPMVPCRWLRLSISEYDFHVGDWDAAREHAGDQPRVAGTATILRQLRLGELALGRGDTQAAIALLEGARDAARRSIEPPWHGPVAALLAQAYRRERRFDDARSAVEAGLARVPPGSQAVGRLAQLAVAGVAVEADRAETARALGRDDEAAEAVARARELLTIGRAAAGAAAGEGVPLARAHVGDGAAELLRAEGRADPAAYAAAAEGWDALDRVYGAALARRREAEAHAAAGDREAAAEVAGRARAVAERIGATWLVDELDGLARRARLTLAGAEPVVEEQPAEPRDELGLTPRERDVLALLAEGRTNREIGEALFMAEKTASVHVSRILAKLDVRSRTEAAAVAHRLGLAA